MGEYNPYAPQIVGQEWVPIRNEDVVFGIGVNTRETGHAFTLATPRILSDGRFYLKDVPTLGQQTTQAYMMSVYPKETESLSGPIRSVIIPCNNGGASGTGGGSVGPAGGAVSFADGVADPSDGKYVAGIWGGNGSGVVEAFFATNQYSQQLTGKRILAVNLLYVVGGVAGGNDLFVNVFPEQSGRAFVNLETSGGGTTGSIDYADTLNDSFFIGDINNVNQFVPIVQRMPMGELDPLWDTTLNLTTSERMPYNYTSLQRFESSSANRRTIRFRSTTTTTTFQAQFHYLALEVLYCEEQRIAFGARAFGNVGSSTYDQRFTPYVRGVNSLPMRTTGRVLNPQLSVGEYLVTISSADIGNEFNAEGVSYPTLNGLRELYAIPSHPAVQVNLPFPRDESIINETFSQETTHILPQLTLHTSGGPLTEVHVYGRQAVAPVYGSIYAEAEIDDDVVPIPGTTYPWVRFYARRWGNTTQRLILTNQAATGQSVYITPLEWDALPEIIDRWKEVTLRFTSPPTIVSAAGSPDWRWTSPAENIGNRWEVLGAWAPALSGIPGNLLNLAPSSYQLGSATYGGTSSVLTWQTLVPPVSGVAADSSSDGVILFSQESAAPTGFGISLFSQPMSGIGQNCGLDPCCIPTSISYLRPQWSPIIGASVDEFGTPAASGWGNDDIGQPWNVNLLGGSLPQNYAKTDGVGTVTITALSASQRITVGAVVADSSQTVKIKIPVIAQGGDIRQGLMSRLLDFNSYYMGLAVFKTDSTVMARIMKRVSGVESTIVEVVVPGLEYQENDWFWLKFDTHGTTLALKVWADDIAEPEAWQLVVTDTSLTSGLNGAYVLAEGGVTNPIPITFSFDSYYSQPYAFGALELQRFDALDTDWNTVMLSTSAAATGFNDYEARVGLLSAYRLRINNVYNFPGAWTPAASGTIEEPGVAIGCEGGHLLIFTSNAAQDGRYNLAYSSVWEGSVEESFSFPEAAEVTFQKMYGRDFVVAFRPLERGGERFSRTVLVQAAAISPPTLGDFRSLRDMAWADLPYICVRDEDGNRWFATVLVPGGNVRRSRQLYMAPVDIIEVTDTPSPVDP